MHKVDTEKIKKHEIKKTKVQLSVYDLSTYNGFLDSVVGGLYHVGVVYYELEWSFGASEDGTGIFWCEPQKGTIGSFKESLTMGESDRTIDETITELKNLLSRWKAKDYNSLSRICLHFSQYFLRFLIPRARLPPVLTSASDSLELFAPFTGNSDSQKISVHVHHVRAERMLRDAEIRMRKFQVSVPKARSTVRVVHGAEVTEPEMAHTVGKLEIVKNKVNFTYSNYALAFVAPVRHQRSGYQPHHAGSEPVVQSGNHGSVDLRPEEPRNKTFC